MLILLAILMMITGAAQPEVVDTKMSRDPLSPIAADYVHLTLEIGEHEPGYVDAYYGPEEWAQQAKRSPRSLPELRAATEVLGVLHGALVALVQEGRQECHLVGVVVQ